MAMWIAFMPFVVIFLVFIGVAIVKKPSIGVVAAAAALVPLLILAGIMLSLITARRTVMYQTSATLAPPTPVVVSAQPANARMRLLMDVPTTTPTTQLSGKAWVDDWVAFLNSAPKDQRWLRIESSLCATDEQARAEARKAAIEPMVPYVKNQMKARNDRSTATKIKVDDEWIRRQIKSSLDRDTVVGDRFVRKIERPYADVWQETILVDVSPKMLDKLIESYNAVARTQFRTEAISWGGLAILGTVIVLAYAFLNAATKGYFVWRLRAAAILVVIVGVLVVMAFSA